MIQEDQRTFQSLRDGEEARVAGSFLGNLEQRQPGRAGNEFKGAGRVRTGGGTRGNVTNLRMVRGKAGELWLSAWSASLRHLIL